MEDAAEECAAEKLDDRLRLQLFLDSIDEYGVIGTKRSVYVLGLALCQ